MREEPRTIRLEIDSAADMVDLARLASEYIGRTAGLDDEAVHWFGMAVHECVVNAVRHGNKGDPRAAVTIAFTLTPAVHPTEIAVSICDRGPGFDPETVANPLAAENTLQPSGRGLLLMRRLMDEVVINRNSDGGTDVRMTKRIQAPRRP